MIRPGILIRGKITPTIDLKGKTNASIIREYPELENVEIKPTTEEQILKSEKYGFDEVKILGVTAEIDENIKSENIKAGVSILDVEGGYEGIDTSDATATSNDILEGKTAYADNKKIEGAIQKYDGAYSGDVAEEIKITDASYLFYGGARINQIEEILPLCKNVINTSNMFANNQFSYKEIDLRNLDMSNVTNVYYIFYQSTYLESIKSFKNLGKGYVTTSENSWLYTLDLSYCKKLTHESLIDVINNLYDLNLTYNVANGGTLYRQSLKLGTTNIAKLTEEEIAIATNKGWNVS